MKLRLILLAIIIIPSICRGGLSGDINHDEEINFIDFSILANQWQMEDSNIIYLWKADIDNDGRVDFDDLKILTEQWQHEDFNAVPSGTDDQNPFEEDLLSNAAFQRDSIAFLDGKQYDNDVPRKKIMAVCGASDLNIIRQDTVIGVGMVSLSPQCEAGEYIYATGTDHRNIYRSLDGNQWEKTTGSIGNVIMIFGSRSGAILVALNKGGRVKLFRSDVGGSDLSDFALPEANLVLPGDKYNAASVEFWNYHQALNGTICIGEYGNEGGFKESRIYRSADDGITFTEVYNEPNNVYHSHRIYKHEATGRWVNVYGDGETRNKIVKSDDDGLSWDTLDPQWDNNFQPTEFYDYNHPTNLLYGSDDMGFIGTFNVLTREYNPLYMDGDRIIPYVFAIYYYNGVFYAGTSSPYQDPNDRTTAIIVSSDLVHWAVYHQFQDKEYGVRKIIGCRNGKIHGVVLASDATTLQHFSFSPVSVTNVLGWCLDPATTNLLNTAQYSSAETDTSQWTAFDQLERITFDAVHGSACLRAYSDSGYSPIYPRPIPVQTGKTYCGRVFLKANGQNVTGRVNWYVYGSNRQGKQNCFALNHNEWTEIVLEPVTIQPGETNITMHIRPRSFNWLGPYDYLADAAQFEQSPPTRWQAGGTPRADDVLYKIIEVPQQWRNILLWSPECRSEWYAGSQKQYIKSWCKDDKNYMELYYDPSDSTFCLQVVQNDEPLPPLRTGKHSFYRNGVVRFEVSCSTYALNFKFSYAGANETLSVEGCDFLKSTQLTSKFGDHNGKSLMSCTVLSDNMSSL
jgi:hypothetical protein